MRMIRKIFPVITFFLLNVNLTFCQSGWYMQYATDLEFPSCIAFADSNKGIITGFNFVSLTSDGGSSWSDIFIGSSSNFSNLQFVNQNTGYLWASLPTILRGLYKTTNSGINWIKINSPFALGGFFFLNTGLGYLAETNGNVNRTTDGGITWQTIINNHNIIPVSIAFANDKYGMLVDMTGRGLSTTDGGNTWFNIFLATGCGGKISYPDPDAVYVASNLQQEINTIRKSTNNGISWTSLYFYNSIFTDIQFVDANTGMVSGKVDMLMRTTDGGTTWVHQNTAGQFSAINDIFLLNANTGWLVNSDGIVFKTTDGGGNLSIKK